MVLLLVLAILPLALVMYFNVVVGRQISEVESQTRNIQTYFDNMLTETKGATSDTNQAWVSVPCRLAVEWTLTAYFAEQIH